MSNLLRHVVLSVFLTVLLIPSAADAHNGDVNLKDYVIAWVAALNDSNWKERLRPFWRDDEDKAYESFKKSHANFRKAFPDYTMTIEILVGDDETVVMAGIVRATFEGEFVGGPSEFTGVKGNGKRAEWRETFIFHKDEDGQPDTIWAQFDEMSRMKQLGLSLPTGSE